MNSFEVQAVLVNSLNNVRNAGARYKRSGDLSISVVVDAPWYKQIFGYRSCVEKRGPLPPPQENFYGHVIYSVCHKNVMDSIFLAKKLNALPD